MRRWMLVGLLALIPGMARATSTYPAPSFFGDGWVLTSGPLAPTNATTGAAAVYGGPAGARVLLAIIDYGGDTAKMRQTWQQMTQQMAQDRGMYLANSGAADVPPLAGCAKVARVYGDDRMMLDFRTAFTLCDDGRARRLLAVETSGPVLGKTGAAASDAVVTKLLALPPAQATPAP